MADTDAMGGKGLCAAVSIKIGNSPWPDVWLTDPVEKRQPFFWLFSFFLISYFFLQHRVTVSFPGVVRKYTKQHFKLQEITN